MKPDNKGFSLLEVIMVVLIISILATLSMPTFRNYKMRIAVAHMLHDVNQIERAMDLYIAEYDIWREDQGLVIQTRIDEAECLSNYDLPPAENDNFVYYIYDVFYVGDDEPFYKIGVHTKEEDGTDTLFILRRLQQDGSKSWDYYGNNKYAKYLKVYLPDAYVH